MVGGQGVGSRAPFQDNGVRTTYSPVPPFVPSKHVTRYNRVTCHFNADPRCVPSWIPLSHHQMYRSRGFSLVRSKLAEPIVFLQLEFEDFGWLSRKQERLREQSFRFPRLLVYFLNFLKDVSNQKASRTNWILKLWNFSSAVVEWIMCEKMEFYFGFGVKVVQVVKMAGYMIVPGYMLDRY